MSHLTLYRAWRPTRFGEVVGQVHVTRTLRNALRSGRVAHAYLFSGPRGTGKTSVAKILARAVNCELPDEGEPCGRCGPCEAIASGRALDVLEVDAASHRGIEEIRELREKVKYAPVALRRKVFIVDEVHMLTQEAFNALLKTLEEPPPATLFVLATTDPHKVPPTIVSRCQRFDFRRLTPEEISGRLAGVCQSLGVRAEPAALDLVARHAEGGLRDALSLLDQAIAFSGQEVTVADLRELLGLAGREEVLAAAEALVAGDPRRLLEAVDRVYRHGRDLRQFAREMAAAFRDALFQRLAPAAGPAPGDELAGLAGVPVPRLIALVQGLARLEGELRWAGPARLALEVGLLGLMLDGPAGASEGSRAAGASAATPSPAASVAPGLAAGAARGPAARAERRAAAAGGAGRPVPAAGRREEAPSPAPAPAPAPAAVTLERARDAWGTVRERVAREQPALGRSLGLLRLGEVRGHRLVLEVRPEDAFLCALLSEPAKREALELAWREALRQPVEVVVRCAGPRGAAEGGAGDAPERADAARAAAGAGGDGGRGPGEADEDALLAGFGRPVDLETLSAEEA